MTIPNARVESWSATKGLRVYLPHDFHVSAERVIERCVKAHNSFIKLSIDVPSRPRTTGEGSQNHKLNGGVSKFCQHTGNDFDDIKLFLKRRAMRRGLPPKTNTKGQIVYSKVDGEPLPMSEADMSTVQCSWVIEEMVQFFAEEEFAYADESPWKVEERV